MEFRPSPEYFHFLDSLLYFIDNYPHTSETYSAALTNFGIAPEDIVQISINHGPNTRAAWLKIIQISIARYSQEEVLQHLFDAMQGSNNMMCYIAFIKDYNLQVLLPDPIPQPPPPSTKSCWNTIFQCILCKK